MEGIQTALTTAFTAFAADAMESIAAIVPIALPVMGAILVIGIGVRVFKRFVH